MIDITVIGEIHYEGLVHMLLEVEKSHDLPSSRWRLRMASGADPVQVQRL